jgi:hypothetical protein
MKTSIIQMAKLIILSVLLLGCLKDTLNPEKGINTILECGPNDYQRNSGKILTISPKGNDITGNGSDSLPWRSLFKACTMAKTPGTTIHVKSGTYIETQICHLMPGISIVGDGSTCVIGSTLTEPSQPILMLRSSAEGTDGKQTISCIRFDGNNLLSSLAIMVIGRSNIKIYNCEFFDFRYYAVRFYGKSTQQGGAPTIFAKGNEFYRNILVNCAGYEIGRGGYANLDFGGQDGMLIYENRIIQNARPIGQNGCCIKSLAGLGHNKGAKIFDNTLIADIRNETSGGQEGYDFAIELWNSYGGMEIYNNEILNGSIDIGGDFQIKGSYDYSVSVHNNVIGNEKLSPVYEVGIRIEGWQTVGDILIYNNKIKNLFHGIAFAGSSGVTYNNIRIFYNIFENIGIDKDGSYGIYAITGYNSNSFTVSNLHILNNVFIASLRPGTRLASSVGIWNRARTNFDHIYIRNNICFGWPDAPIRVDSIGTINNLFIQNNIFYQNGNNNAPLILKTPSNYANSNNYLVEPGFLSVSDYRLSANSPAINKGMHVGLSFDHAGKPIVHEPDIGAFEFSGK